MKTKALLFLFLSAALLHAEPDAPAAKPHVETYQDQKIPIGDLGLPLGTFAVVGGKCRAIVPGDDTYCDFAADTVNGVKLSSPVEIAVPYCAPALQAGKRYVIHGFENGGWRGSPPLPPDESADIWKEPFPKAPAFSFVCRFHLTSVESEDGVLTKDACPVDPSFHLAKPEFPTHIITPPRGVTGKLLGTYTTITIGAARDPAKDRAAELFAINGNPVDHYLSIDVPSLAPPSGSNKLVVHGYEGGDWNGLITAPASESKIDAMQARPSRLPEPNSIGFMCYFLVTNWTDRTPRPASQASGQPSAPAYHP